MKVKKCIASFVSAVFCLTMITGTASAHINEICEGNFTQSSKLKQLCKNLSPDI